MTVKILNTRQKRDVVESVKKGTSRAELARRYNVSTDTIRRVLKEYEATANQKTVSPNPSVTTSNNQALSKLKSMAATAASASGTKPGTTPKPSGMVPAKATGKVVPKETVITWTIGPEFASVITDLGNTYNANSGHAMFQDICLALMSGDTETAVEIITPAAAVTKYAEGNVEINDGVVTYKGLELDTGLTNRILDAMSAGRPFEFMVRFLDNLMENPSYRAVKELFGFLAHNDIELTDDGYFLAWKRVNANYTDMYTGKIDNSPGKTVEVTRNLVDEDSDRTCSFGLHVAARHYLPHYGGGRGAIVQVKVDPADVVAIPKDYNNAKLRCCRYQVMKDVSVGFKEY